MTRGPLPGERPFDRPRSNTARAVLRISCWLGAVVWFLAPPAIVFHFLPVVLAVPAGLLMWIAGFILLGRLARGLTPLPGSSARAT
jgi:hypothetical protein